MVLVPQSLWAAQPRQLQSRWIEHCLPTAVIDQAEDAERSALIGDLGD
jgi:hypothetical protein